MEDISSNVCMRPVLERKARPQEQFNCPRCNSTNTKFCYYNNYSLTQPRFFCKTCRKYWTDVGSLRNVLVEDDIFIGTTLIDMCCKVGDLESARKVFDKIPKKDVITWNAIILALSQSVNPKEVLGFIRNMQLVSVEPDLVSIVNLVPALSSLGNIDACSKVPIAIVLLYEEPESWGITLIVLDDIISTLGMKLGWLENGAKMIMGSILAIKYDKSRNSKIWFNSMVIVYIGWEDAINDPKKAVDK
ncbi:hypothetical protein GH714_002058 [Hevea brasiliensis]|uniref:Dof zinc finger protein n=1 Tax=Hevea brasiliensis TaxID=3981 RepID=A0A6A6MWA2_HEVBR|nr:hypothetical protein GH714_002058 [Hevea brasiliensis]